MAKKTFYEHLADLDRETKKAGAEIEKYIKSVERHLGVPPPPVERKDAPKGPRKLAAARKALESVKAKGIVPSVRRVALESEKLGQKVTRATISNYRDKGLLDF